MTGRRTSLAVFGPLPPQPTGVARYIHTSAIHLERHFDVTCASSPTDADPHDFDHVLYHLGNNAMHHGAFRALHQRPGPIVLHEFNNLDYYHQAWTQLTPNEQHHILHAYGRHLGEDLPNRSALDAYAIRNPTLDLGSLDLGIEQLAVHAATTTLVHHPATAQLLRERHPQADIRALPFPVEPITTPDPHRVRRRLHLPDHAMLFATFGFIGQYKRVEQILEAWQCWTDRPDHAHLLLAGELQYPLPIPDDPTIHHTGHLTDRDFDDLLLSVDCAIQLRHPWLGETSGPVTTLLAHHRPVILSDTPGMHTDAPTVTHVPVGPGEVDTLVHALRQHIRNPAPAPTYNPDHSWRAWAETLATALTTPAEAR